LDPSSPRREASLFDFGRYLRVSGLFFGLERGVWPPGHIYSVRDSVRNPLGFPVFEPCQRKERHIVGGGNHEQGKRDATGMTRFSQPAPVEKRAMDQWMQRALKAQYTQAAEEPVPDELLALIRTFPQH
jgi:hypothetical protein